MNMQLADGVVTLLVRHRITVGQDQASESWLRRTIARARSYPGHLGIDVVRGHDGGLALFTSVLRFASTELLQQWLDSTERRDLVHEARHLLADGDQTEINGEREFWFTPPQANAPTPPPRWKQACVTFMVILPLSMLMPWLWQQVFNRLPWLGGYVQSNVLITLSIVLLVVYVFMPRVTRLFAGWLR
jgi:uncharacterized protein